jgi:hydrogenase maturation protein HypF
LEQLSRLHGLSAQRVICDQDRSYPSSGLARETGLPLEEVQHHVAHFAACLADNREGPPALGVSFDGSGWGPDGTIWGGEFVKLDENEIVTRRARLLPFALPVGEEVQREARRSAAGVLHGLYGGMAFDMNELEAIADFTMEERQEMRRWLDENSGISWTSSAGRLFDAVASLLGMCQRGSYNGQAAAVLEYEARRTRRPESLRPMVLDGLELDWRPTILDLLQRRRAGHRRRALAAGFHRALADGIVAVARREGLFQVALSGGCFQNMVLLDFAVDGLKKAGLRPLWHQRVPPNDGGIALGQLAAAAWKGGGEILP